jgi:cobalt-zinc-cadmium resistance protein CzcA
MLEKLVTFALQQRLFVVVAAVVIGIGGWLAWTRLPIEAFPDVQDVQVLIVTQYPGQAPEEVERSISMPIEREMNGVANLIQVRSVSIFGLSVVTVTFAFAGSPSALEATTRHSAHRLFISFTG